MNIITTIDQLNEFVETYSAVDAFAWDVETIGENRLFPAINDVCWISFATELPGSAEVRVDVIPMGHPNGEFEGWDKPLLLAGERRLAEGKELLESSYSKDQRKWKPKFGPAPKQLTPRQVFDAIEPIMFSRKLKIAHNAKFDLKSVAKYYRGRVPSKPFFDTLMAAFLIDNRNKFSLGLADCVKRELGVHVEKGVGENVAEHSFADVAKYSGIDAEVTWNLYRALAPRLEGGLRKVWHLEMDVLAALCDMELTGTLIDQEALQEAAKEIEKGKLEAEAKCYRIAGKAFSLNSVKAKQELLFATEPGKNPRLIPANPKINIALTPKGKEARDAGQALTVYHYAVSADALELYRGKDDLVEAIIEYQEMNKLLTTYITPYTGGQVKRTTNGKERTENRESILINGKVYTNFKAHGAETGRMSSSNPNLQNIPSSGAYGKIIRNLFVPPKGFKLIDADYSQIEPRIIASFSNDPVMVNNYLTGGDIYTAIGDTMGVDRKAGKVLVLAISYGVGPDKIASQIGCSVKEATDLLNRFEAQFASVTQYKSKVVRLAKESGRIPFVETMFGRRRYIPELLIGNGKNARSLDKEEWRMLSRAERQAFNTVIQGSAADLMKLAIVRAHSCFLDEPDINLILTVHDEIVVQAPNDMADEVAEAVRDAMENINLPQITVPLVADVKIVDKWGEAK